ncbi:MAG: hypothetical protein N2448_08600 [Caloramator sp.]|nr:hypothetical protein [Caloramator sp.]
MKTKFFKSTILLIIMLSLLVFVGNIGVNAASKNVVKKQVKKVVKKPVKKIMTANEAVKLFKTKFKPEGTVIYANGVEGAKDLVIKGVKYYCILNKYDGGGWGYALHFLINSKTGEVWLAKSGWSNDKNCWQITGLNKKINSTKELEEEIESGL